MAKGRSRRPVPSTPGPDDGTDSAHTPGPPGDPAAQPGATVPVPDRRTASRGAQVEQFLVTGTNCVAGHERGRELSSGAIGAVPSRRKAWLGIGLLLWCGFGLMFILDPTWISMGVALAVVWLLFSLLVQRREGHRGRCWRTRAWRHAWGGLVPSRD